MSADNQQPLGENEQAWLRVLKDQIMAEVLTTVDNALTGTMTGLEARMNESQRETNSELSRQSRRLDESRVHMEELLRQQRAQTDGLLGEIRTQQGVLSQQAASVQSVQASLDEIRTMIQGITTTTTSPSVNTPLSSAVGGVNSGATHASGLSGSSSSGANFQSSPPVNGGNNDANPLASGGPSTVGGNFSNATPRSTSSSSSKKLLQKPESFEGKKASYKSWLTSIKAKLSVDLSGESDIAKFWAIHSFLGSTPKRQLDTWINEQVNPDGSARYPNGMTDRLLRRLDFLYSDPNQVAVAARKLGQLKQGSKSFHTFLNDFELLIAEAGGSSWPFDVKKAYFEKGVSEKITQAILAADIPREWSDYVKFLSRVSENIDAQQWRKPIVSGSAKKDAPKHDSDHMDWEASGAAKAAALRAREMAKPPAKWVKPEVIAARKSRNACTRCGSDEHFYRDCRYGPAKRPEVKEGKVNATKGKSDQKGKGKPRSEDSDGEAELDDDSDAESLKDDPSA